MFVPSYTYKINWKSWWKEQLHSISCLFLFCSYSLISHEINCSLCVLPFAFQSEKHFPQSYFQPLLVACPHEWRFIEEKSESVQWTFWVVSMTFCGDSFVSQQSIFLLLLFKRYLMKEKYAFFKVILYLCTIAINS